MEKIGLGVERFGARSMPLGIGARSDSNIWGTFCVGRCSVVDQLAVITCVRRCAAHALPAERPDAAASSTPLVDDVAGIIRGTGPMRYRAVVRRTSAMRPLSCVE